MRIRTKVAAAALGLAIAAGIVALSAYWFVDGKLRMRLSVPAEFIAVQIPTDATSIAEGDRLVTLKTCRDCHGVDMAGGPVIDEPLMGRVWASNLTSGAGSDVAGFTGADWARAIRFGLGPSGHRLIAMPSGDYRGLSDQDVGRIAAYLVSLPPVARTRPPSHVALWARVKYALGFYDFLFAYDGIDRVTPPLAVAPAESGAYLAKGCAGCHGADYAGGPVPGVGSDWPLAANLTPRGPLAKWSVEDFRRVLRTGVTPEGRQIDPQYMPWKNLASLTDGEINAIYLFLRGLPGE